MADIWTDLTDAIGKNMSIDEMNKKYQNTFLILKTQKDEKEIIVQYLGYQDDYHQFKDEFGMRIILKHETEQQVICKFPERCLFNHELVAYEFVRLPTRQYKRGICSDNATIYSPVRHFFDSKKITWTIKHLKNALFPWYPTNCQEALETLTSQQRLSIAISPQFMLTQPLTSDKHKYWLFFSNKLIGYFEKDIFYIKHRLFKQEVLDNIHLFKPYQIEL